VRSTSLVTLLSPNGVVVKFASPSLTLTGKCTEKGRMEAIVSIEGVEKDYPLGNLTVRALQGVDLQISTGEFTTIAGPSGSGKTTLLNLIGCVDVPTRGVVRIAGTSTSQLGDKALTQLRLRTIGFIFQSFNLIPVLSLYRNVEFPLLLQGGIEKAERDRRVREMVDKVGLTPQLQQRPNELSGGQRQRVAIARALVTKPQIVLADEPTANLDSTTGLQIIELMRDINHREQTTFIFSTHDHKVMEHADRIVHIADGKISRSEAVKAGRGAAVG
jgi:putative ABC transport system ATP-binding protein